MLSLPLNVWILAISLALFMSLSVFTIFIGGIIGKTLTPVANLATLPVSMLIIGTTLSIVPVIKIMSNIGRKNFFLSSCIYTIVIIALTIFALYIKSFYLFCLSSLLFGVTIATMGQFRFAAIESVDISKSTNAIALVTLGGLFSAFLGPEIATIGENYFDVRFVGSYLLLGLLFIVAFVFLNFFKAVKPIQLVKPKATRSLAQIIKQPVFIIAISSATIGYMIMSYIMTATPMSMHIMDGFSLNDTKFVIQSHVIAMFLPSLFTPIIVKMIGTNKMIITGLVMYFVCIFIAYNEHSFINYWASLLLLGIGWNFLFIGGTSLISLAYTENEKYKVQSLNDFVISGSSAMASLSAGWFVFSYGWEVVLLSTIPILLFQLFLLFWWLNKEKSC